MKNEQQQNQNGKQDQPLKHPPQQPDAAASKTGNTKKNIQGNQQQGADKSNISADNEGRIGKAHDRWPADDKKENQDIQKEDRRTRSDKTVTEPEIDAPIYDPEKTEKKIPKM